VRPLVIVAAAAAFVAAPSPAVAGSKPASLQRYLSSMSWPVRASGSRALTLLSGIDGWFSVGDPPYLGQIARGCRSLRAVEADPRGELLKITAPPRLRAIHLRLVAAYSQARVGCTKARTAALAARSSGERYFLTKSVEDRRAWNRATAAARRELRLQRGRLESFVQAVRAWRSVAFGEADASGVRAVWLGTLRV
jgi:hypothetical protein